MTPFLLLVLVLVLCACAFGYNMYRTNASKRAHDKRRNMFDDRV